MGGAWRSISLLDRPIQWGHTVRMKRSAAAIPKLSVLTPVFRADLFLSLPPISQTLIHQRRPVLQFVYMDPRRLRGSDLSFRTLMESHHALNVHLIKI